VTAQARVSKFGKRQTLTVWLILCIVAASIGSQNWFAVEYEFGSTTKLLVSVGTSAIPMLNLAIWGGFITLFGVLFSQRIASSIIAALGSIASVATALNLLPQLGNRPPQALFAAVSKLSGITGDHIVGANGVSTTDGWISYKAEHNFVLAFIIVAMLLALLQAATASLALRWPKRVKTDRYASQSTKSKRASDASAGGSTKGSNKGSGAASKDDAISLWDSQR
jgi:hypothetical protein